MMRNNLYRAFNRIKGKAAFTLGEALVAVLILLLVTSIVAAGIPAAIRAYNNVVMASNSEVLLSTSMSALRNELSTAEDIQVSKDKTSVTYKRAHAKTRSKIYLRKPANDKEKVDIMYKRNAEAADSTAIRLVSKEASDKKMDLHVEYTGIVYETGSNKISFSGLHVNDRDGKATPASVEKYSIRIIS